MHRDLLTVSPHESIYGVIGRMETLLTVFKKNYPSFVPFLETYAIVTKTVAAKHVLHADYYRNPELLEKLDVHFAQLYFHPLLKFLEKGKCVTPWKTYFEYCSNPGIPFVQMLLGINAHINTDLCATVTALKYREHRDFLVINDILEEVIPHIMRFLAIHEHDVFGLGGMVFKRFMTTEFKNIIVRWRLNAWRNALKLSRKNYPVLCRKTEQVGKEIIDIFNDIIALKARRDVLNRLRTLKVQL